VSAKRVNLTYERVEALRRKHPKLTTAQLCSRLKVRPVDFYNSRQTALGQKRGRSTAVAAAPTANRVVARRKGQREDGESNVQVFWKDEGSAIVRFPDGTLFAMEALNAVAPG
jgi:hypothetical protein